MYIYMYMREKTDCNHTNMNHERNLESCLHYKQMNSWFSSGLVLALSLLKLSFSCRKTVCVAMRRMKLRHVYIEMFA